MDEEASYPYYSSAAVGAYRPNTILTRLKSVADLEPEFGDPAPAALSIQAHEYVHHLHNYSTYTGVLQFFVNFLLFRLFVGGVNGGGEFSLALVSPDNLSMLREMGQLLVNIDGTCSQRPKKILPPTETVKWAFSARLTKYKSFVDFPAVEVSGSVSTSSSSEDFEFTAGHAFLTEGVAYCVDREMRRNQGTAEHLLDSGVPTYPYLVYRPLLCHLVGRDVTPSEQISVGVAAMMGKPLTEVCKLLRESDDSFKTLSLVIQKAAQAGFANLNDKILPLLRQTRDEFAEGDHLYSAINQFITLIVEGEKLRLKWPALEHAFLDDKLNKDNYANLISTFLDVCVLQEKPEQEAVFLWTGNGTIAKDDSAAIKLAVLQASIHFVRLHLKKDGNLGSTAELRAECCPFSGACETEKKFDDPDVCRRAPWKRFAEQKVTKQYCWYAAGVSVLSSNHP